MGPEPEGDVIVGLAADVEGLGIVEDRLVAVGRGVEEQHVLPGRDGLAVELDVHGWPCG